MRRRLFSLAAAASLLLCLAAAGAWVRARSRVRDEFYYQRSPVHEWHGSNMRDGVKFSATRFDRPTGDPVGQWWHQRSLDPPPGSGWVYTPLEPASDPVLGFRWARRDVLMVGFVSGDGVSPSDGAYEPPQSWVANMTLLVVPHWALVAATSVLPLAWAVRRWRTRHHRRPGHCRGCGYDLRASTGRCPECGSAMPVGATMHAA